MILNPTTRGRTWICIFFLLFPGWTHSQDLNDLDRIVGEWKIQENSGNSYEVWEKLDDSLFKGRSFSVVDGEQVVQEELLLYQTHLGIFYIPTVKHNGKPVPFKLTSGAEDYFRFENPDHDFPNSITYRFIDNNHLQVIVKGSSGGNSRQFKVNMRREIR